MDPLRLERFQNSSKNHGSGAAQIVKRISFKKLFSTRVVARQIKHSQSTIWKTAKKMKLRPYHQTRAPILTDKHRISRLKFAKVNANKDWSRVLFIDENKIELFSKPNQKNDIVWGPIGTMVEPMPRVAHPAKWMCVLASRFQAAHALIFSIKTWTVNCFDQSWSAPYFPMQKGS